MDKIPARKWSITDKIFNWLFVRGKENTYQKILIPYHIAMGIRYRYRFSDIFEFCLCCWLGFNYPFENRRPDLRKW